MDGINFFLFTIAFIFTVYFFAQMFVWFWYLVFAEESTEEKVGLYEKFNVNRLDGRDQVGGDREHARYFTLDYFYDKYSRIALLKYIESLEESGTNKKLAEDLRKELLVVEALRPTKEEV